MRAGLAVLALVAVLVRSAAADVVMDVRMPPGAHRDAGGEIVAGGGLRDTTDFLVKELDRRGIAVDRIGPSRVRGVELTRFVSQTPSTAWLAIHVLRTAGKTMIFFVPRVAS